jgi:hypothetical protein
MAWSGPWNTCAFPLSLPGTFARLLDARAVCRWQLLLDSQLLPLCAHFGSQEIQITRMCITSSVMFRKHSVSPAQWITPLECMWGVNQEEEISIRKVLAPQYFFDADCHVCL